MTQLQLDGLGAAPAGHVTRVVFLDDDTLQERRTKREKALVGCVDCFPAGQHDVVWVWQGLCYCERHRPYRPL